MNASEHDMFDSMGDMITKLKQEVEQLKKNQQWIPVSERLPNFDKPVLIFLKNDLCEVMTVAKYRKITLQNKDIIGWFTTVETYGENALAEQYVIAWQPLPKPYESEVKADE